MGKIKQSKLYRYRFLSIWFLKLTMIGLFSMTILNYASLTFLRTLFDWFLPLIFSKVKIWIVTQPLKLHWITSCNHCPLWDLSRSSRQSYELLPTFLRHYATLFYFNSNQICFQPQTLVTYHLRFYLLPLTTYPKHQKFTF